MFHRLSSLQSVLQAGDRVAALAAAVDELAGLEHYIRTTKPGRKQATFLTEEIMRELLARLNFMGFDFPASPVVRIGLCERLTLRVCHSAGSSRQWDLRSSRDLHLGSVRACDAYGRMLIATVQGSAQLQGSAAAGALPAAHSAAAPPCVQELAMLETESDTHRQAPAFAA